MVAKCLSVVALKLEHSQMAGNDASAKDIAIDDGTFPQFPGEDFLAHAAT